MRKVTASSRAGSGSRSHLQDIGGKTLIHAPQQINRLIADLPRRERLGVLALAEVVELLSGAVLCEASAPLEHAYFPLSGFVSLAAGVQDHEPLGLALIGNEGLLGATLTLRVDAAPLCAVVLGTGSALRLTAAQLRKLLTTSPALARGINRYLYELILQLSQTATCTHFHEVRARLARWLLMAQDRARNDRLHMTHKTLAAMLGVRRSAVTLAAGALQAHGCIHYARGEIQIADRRLLEAEACGCYSALVADSASTRQKGSAVQRM